MTVRKGQTLIITGSFENEEGLSTKAGIFRILSAGGDTWLPQALEHVRDLPNFYLNQFSFLYLECPDIFLTIGGKYQTN